MQSPQYPYTSQPAPQMPPPPKSNAGLIIGIIVAIVVVVLGFIGILVVVGVMGYLRAAKAARSSAYSAPTAIPATLTEKYASSNGLVTIHYPSDWAAKSIDHATLTASRNLSDGTDELVYAAGVENPISDDVNEFSRVLIGAMRKNIDAAGGTWSETSRKRTVCFRAYSGLEITGTYTLHSTRENVHMCFFMQPNRGYELKTIVPDLHESTDLPLMQSMIDATEIR